MMKHVTIKDIARSLCISVSTVSRALTDDKNIRKETREMVIEEAKRLGYKRNPVAMNLKMGAYEHHWCHRAGDAYSLCFAGD